MALAVREELIRILGWENPGMLAPVCPGRRDSPYVSEQYLTGAGARRGSMLKNRMRYTLFRRYLINATDPRVKRRETHHADAYYGALSGLIVSPKDGKVQLDVRDDQNLFARIVRGAALRK